MRVIKYFFEEPTVVDLGNGSPGDPPSEEGLQALLRGHRHYRGYLAATDLDQDLVGGSSLEDQAAARVLLAVFEGPIWFSNQAPGQEEGILRLLTAPADILQALSTMSADSVMITGMEPTSETATALTTGEDRKSGMHLIAALLDQGCTLVFPEPAHTGHDWSVFSAQPVADRIREAMAHAPEDTRTFAIPYQKARGEDKFYFEQYDPELFAEYEITG